MTQVGSLYLHQTPLTHYPGAGEAVYAARRRQQHLEVVVEVAERVGSVVDEGGAPEPHALRREAAVLHRVRVADERELRLEPHLLQRDTEQSEASQKSNTTRHNITPSKD